MNRVVSKPPSVSICLPNLNTARYLPERFESIFAQTFTDWECVVSDNFSDDGAWEVIQSYAARDARIKAEQAPRDPQGMYPNWNNCLRRARGELIYIATSDDTMSPDCLEKLHGALQRHPDCGIAHCQLLAIDDRGQPASANWRNWDTVKYFGGLIDRAHIRPQGHDAVVGVALGTPYFSITQVMFRRELLDKAGYFEGKWGSYGDFAWQMRATLHTSTVHVPETLATWRVHPAQASQLDKLAKDRANGVLVQMVREFIAYTRRAGLPQAGGLPNSLTRYAERQMIAEQWRAASFWQKPWLLLRNLLLHPRGTIVFVRKYLDQKSTGSFELCSDVRADVQLLGIAAPSSC